MNGDGGYNTWECRLKEIWEVIVGFSKGSNWSQTLKNPNDKIGGPETFLHENLGFNQLPLYGKQSHAQSSYKLDLWKIL